jgi:hypothetical protein
MKRTTPTARRFAPTSPQGADGRALRTPLWWYPRLVNATPGERAVVEFMPMGIHWPEIDEDISVASMLRGQKAPGARAPEGLGS